MEASALLSAADGLRADGRTATQLRPIVCRRSSLSRSDGSATWTSGRTTVVASIFGPRTASSRAGGSATSDASAALAVSVEWRGPGGVSAAAAAAAVSSSSSSDTPTPPSAAAAATFIRSCVQASLEQRELPTRSAVAVVVHVTSADGGELAAAANAVSAALSDAALPLRFSFAAAEVAVAADGRGGSGGGKGDSSLLLLLDPTSSEEACSFATATVAFPCASREPGAPPLVDQGSVLAVRCCCSTRASESKSAPASPSPSSKGFGADPECSLLAVAVDAAAKGAQRMAEFGRMSLEASLGGGGS